MARKITNKLFSLSQMSLSNAHGAPHSLKLFISSPDANRLCTFCVSRDYDFDHVVDVPQIPLGFLFPCFMDYFFEKRRQIHFFYYDMHGGFISLAKRCFLDVKTCINMFYVVKLLNDNVSDIQRPSGTPFSTHPIA